MGIVDFSVNSFKKRKVQVAFGERFRVRRALSKVVSGTAIRALDRLTKSVSEFVLRYKSDDRRITLALDDGETLIIGALHNLANGCERHSRCVHRDDVFPHNIGN